MTDDKPMSAEEAAADVIDRFDYGMSDGLRGRLIQEFATALREHAAEAVAAERARVERIAAEAHARWDETFSVLQAQADDGPRQAHAAGARDAAEQIRDRIRARTEGGEGDG